MKVLLATSPEKPSPQKSISKHWAGQRPVCLTIGAGNGCQNTTAGHHDRDSGTKRPRNGETPVPLDPLFTHTAHPERPRAQSASLGPRVSLHHVTNRPSHWPTHQMSTQPTGHLAGHLTKCPSNQPAISPNIHPTKRPSHQLMSTHWPSH